MAIVGDDEVEGGEIGVKWMDRGEEERVKVEELVSGMQGK
ncbi:His/Gly/Thr/Pro-type tRNA ligase C-terminal domain-containing protein [Paenibacillus xylanexedens]|nr:His/Gly/Thr/Pro-type tRNA ligase C-terminal domain-containing protein [Paenibacillus xylanexedens]